MLSFSPHYPQNTTNNAQSALSVHTPPRQHSPAPLQVPRRTDSLSSNIAKPKPTSPLIQATEDAKFAKIVLNTPITEEKVPGWEDRERELIEMLSRMTNWVEELGSLLQKAYKNQTDLETALTLTRSNLQLALANNEMLEEALKRGGGNGKDVGWRRWSEREGVRRSSSVKDHDRPNSVSDVPPSYPSPPLQPPQPSSQQQQQNQQSGPSRFFGFKSPLGLSRSPSNSSTTSPTSTSASVSASSLLPSISIPSRGPSPSPLLPPSATESSREKRLADELAKERASKAALEDELESLSQALFEEANKMVSLANRKLAETEEELRIARDEKEALKGALRIVEGERESLILGGTTIEGTIREVEIKTRPPASPPEDHPVKVSTSHDANIRSFRNPIPPAPDTTMSIATSTPSQYSLSSLSSSERPVSLTAPLVSSEPQTLRVDRGLPREDPPALSSPSESLSSVEQQGVNGMGHRWSRISYVPRSRDAVRAEFEDAMKRMRDLVEGEEHGEEVEEGTPSLEADTKTDSAENVRLVVSMGSRSRTTSQDGLEKDVGRNEDNNPWTT